jgi:hypothetical protein
MGSMAVVVLMDFRIIIGTEHSKTIFKLTRRFIIDPFCDICLN